MQFRFSPLCVTCPWARRAGRRRADAGRESQTSDEPNGYPATFAPRLHTPRPRFFLRRKPCNSTSAASCARSAPHLCAACSSRFLCSPRFRRGSMPISAVSLFARTSVAPPRRVSRCRSRASYAQFPHLSPPDAFSPETSAAPSRLPVSLQITSAPPRAHLGSKC